MRSSVLPARRLLPLLVATLWALVGGPASAQALPPEALPSAERARQEEAEAQALPPEQRERVVEIRVEGNRRVELEVIRRALRTQVNEPFDPTRTAEDLRGLWALGFFEDVQLLVQRLPRGLAYVVRVKERPTLREVRLTGNEELSKDDFKETLDLKPFSILDLDAVKRNAKKIQEKYVEKGFFLAEVDYKLEPLETGSAVDVVFVIREHAKVMVKEIRLLGARQVPEEELEAVMATKEGGYLSFLTGEGTYREELFQRDLAVVQAAYYDRGFINVRVDPPHVSMSADKRFIYITLNIEEGEPYDIGKLDFSGDLTVPKEQLARLMTSEEGERFNRSKLSKDIQAITDVYADQGYAYANITPQTATDPAKKTVDLTFHVEKGKQVTIERIDIVGNSKTRDRVIRRELRVYEGELTSGSGLRRSRERVTALGFFETVDVTQRPGSRDDTMVVTVDVREKATGTFQVGLGFSNVENFIFTAQVSQNNFLGWGQSISASAQISGLRSLIQLSYFDPFFLDTNYLLSADFYRTQTEFEGFERNALGGSVSVGRYLLEDLHASVGYTNEYVDVDVAQGFGQVLLANQFLDGTTSAVRFSLTYDKRDNRLFPSRGFVNFGSVEYAPSILGGTFRFTRYSAYTRFYVPLFLGLVFKTNATIGYIQQLDQDNLLPISELFYLGGINTVRGYFLRSISPTLLVGRSDLPDTAVTEFRVGGNKQLILNAELEFPIFEKVGIRGVVFYDAGNAYGFNERFFEDTQDDVPLGLFHSVGFGFRWFSPIGPLRFEWGIPLSKRPDDEPVLFEFTIGNFF